MKIVILAGGSGKRLWPLSSNDFPKQFLKIFDKESLLQKTCLRFKDWKFLTDIFVVINKKHKKIIKKQIKEINFQEKIRIIIEPEQKNTAGAILFTFKHLKEFYHLNEDEKILFLPSDHLIVQNEKFLANLEDLNSKSLNDIVIFGIQPKKPETGYGYIKYSDKYLDTLFKVDSFVEKPSFDKAKEFISDGKHLWNAGIFLFTEKIFKREMQSYCSDMFDFYKLPYKKLIRNFFKARNISIDYALLEKTPNILVNILDVSWSDVGSWDSVFEAMEKDDNLNVLKGNVLSLDTRNSLIFGEKRVILTIGLKDILAIETPDKILIAKKGESQKLKKLLEKIEN